MESPSFPAAASPSLAPLLQREALRPVLFVPSTPPSMFPVPTSEPTNLLQSRAKEQHHHFNEHLFGSSSSSEDGTTESPVVAPTGSLPMPSFPIFYISQDSEDIPPTADIPTAAPVTILMSPTTVKPNNTDDPEQPVFTAPTPFTAAPIVISNDDGDDDTETRMPFIAPVAIPMVTPVAIPLSPTVQPNSDDAGNDIGKPVLVPSNSSSATDAPVTVKLPCSERNLEYQSCTVDPSIEVEDSGGCCSDAAKLLLSLPNATMLVASCAVANASLYGPESMAWPDEWCDVVRDGVVDHIQEEQGCMCLGSDNRMLTSNDEESSSSSRRTSAIGRLATGAVVAWLVGTSF